MIFVRTLCTALSFWMVLSAVVIPAANAQSVFDVTAPIITINEVNDGIAGETQVFTAEVTDDLGLKDVKLYIRYAGQQPYTSMTMERLGNTDFYSANVATKTNETRTMEYYIQARDRGGNRVIKGFAFEPLLRELNAPEPASAEAPAQTSVQSTANAAPEVSESATATKAAEKKPTAGKLKWWHVVLGVLALGALAAAAGGDDGPSEPASVPVTVTITQP